VSGGEPGNGTIESRRFLHDILSRRPSC